MAAEQTHNLIIDEGDPARKETHMHARQTRRDDACPAHICMTHACIRACRKHHNGHVYECPSQMYEAVATSASKTKTPRVRGVTLSTLSYRCSAELRLSKRPFDVSMGPAGSLPKRSKASKAKQSAKCKVQSSHVVYIYYIGSTMAFRNPSP